MRFGFNVCCKLHSTTMWCFQSDLRTFDSKIYTNKTEKKLIIAYTAQHIVLKQKLQLLL